jgi:hypothetical protein
VLDIIGRFIKHTMFSVAKTSRVFAVSKWLKYFTRIDPPDHKRSGIVREPRLALEQVNKGVENLHGQDKEEKIYAKFCQAIEEDLREAEVPGM